MIDYYYNGIYLVITFPDGSEAFLQGEEAAELEEQLDNCESEEICQYILDQYSEVAEFPES